MGKFYNVSAQVSSPRGVFVRADGLKLFVQEDSGEFWRYSITDGDVSTASYDTGQTVTISESNGAADIYISSDGLHMYSIEPHTIDLVHEMVMSVAWDLTSASFVRSFDISAQTGNPSALYFSDDGTKMYTIGSTTDAIKQWTLSTAWNISTATYASKTLSVAGETAVPNGLSIINSGGYAYVTQFGTTYRYTLSTPWDIGTGSYDTGQVYVNAVEDGFGRGLHISEDGTQMYFGVDQTPETVYQFTMGTAYDLTTAYYDPPSIADGAVTLTPTIAGTATGPTRATGAVTLTPTIAGVGTSPIHSYGEIELIPTISATGYIFEVDGAVTITPTILGTVSIQSVLSADVTLPSFTATGDFYYINGQPTLPVFTSTGTMQQEPLSQVTLPSLSATGDVISGGVLDTFGITLPSLVASGSLGNSADITLPLFEVTATIESESLISGSALLPAFQATGDTSSDRQITGDNELPLLVVTGLCLNGGATVSTASIPAFVATGTILAGTVATSSVELPVLEALAALVHANTAEAVLSLPSMSAYGVFDVVVGTTHKGVSLNTESLGAAEYTNYPYHSLVEFDGRRFGVSDSGIFELTGDDDDGTDIDASFKFGFHDFGTSDLKRMPYVYLGYKADGGGAMQIQVDIDGSDATRTYPVGKVSSTSGIKRGRAKVGKGLKSKYLKVGVANVAGAGFEIEDLGVLIQTSKRRVE